MFELTDKAIAPLSVAKPHAHSGGIVYFEGRVRSLNEGREVIGLDYEAYAPLALSEGGRILAEAKEKFALFAIHAVHRLGALAVGDIAVWAYASAMHRREAFQATEYVIHQIKHRVPIWKKEHYADGSSEWVRCHHIEAT